jgi:hypothetical protein
MTTLTEQAEPFVGKLLKSDVNQLYEQLGIRSAALRVDPATAGSFDPAVVYEGSHIGMKDEVRELGKRLFKRWNREGFALLCGGAAEDEADRQQMMKAVGLGDTAAAAALSALLVSNFGVAPAIAAVVAALVVKRFFRPTYDEFCAVWRKNLDPVV